MPEPGKLPGYRAFPFQVISEESTKYTEGCTGSMRMRGAAGRNVTGGYEIIGDIAIITGRNPGDPTIGERGAMLLAAHHNVRTVLLRKSHGRDGARVPEYELIAGEVGTVTTHREYGFSYSLDLSRVFFSGKLGFERQRVAGLVRSGERVMVPFAGAGPFVVPAAARGARVMAVERSPVACQFLRENLERNGVAGLVKVIEGDVFGDSRPGRFDRLIVPAPYSSRPELVPFLRWVRPGSMIHLYLFASRRQIPGLSGEFRCSGLLTRRVRKCGNVAPSVSRWVFDLECGALHSDSPSA
jgi:tRNA (guanine37-N1)-methyltransferase